MLIQVHILPTITLYPHLYLFCRLLGIQVTIFLTKKPADIVI